MTIYDIIGYDEKTVKRVINEKENYYLSYPIKKSNGRLRWLDAPQEPLKQMQRNIMRNLVYKFRTHKSAVGFVKGKGVKHGALTHLGNRTLLCLDLSDFFTSIKFDMVYRLVLFMLSDLSGRQPLTWDSKVDVKIITELLTYKGSLPQGSPASPAVANLYCLNMDTDLNNLARRHSIKYSRYADDLAFSHEDPKFNFYDNSLFQKIRDILDKYGLDLNNRKTRVLRPHKRMVVTGVVINQKLSVPKYVWRNLRAQIHNLKVKQSKLDLIDYQRLRGQIEWIRSLHPNRGESLLQQLGEIPLKS